MKINRLHHSIFPTIVLIFSLILLANVKTFADSSFQLEFSPAADKFLSGNARYFQIWETNTGKLLKTFADSDEAYWDFASFTADGKYILLVDNKNKVAWWNIETAEFTSDVSLKPSRSYAVSADKKLFAAAAPSNEEGKMTIAVYEIGEKKLSLKKEFSVPLSGIAGMHFLKGNKDLLAVDFSPVIVSLETGKIKKEFSTSNEPYRYSLLQNLNSLLIIGRFSKSPLKPYVMNLTSGKKRGVLTGKSFEKLFSEINTVGYSPVNPDTVFAAGKSSDAKTGTLAIWNLRTGRTEKVLASGKEITAAVFSPDGRNILFQDLAGNITLANAATGITIHEYNTKPDPKINNSAD